MLLIFACAIEGHFEGKSPLEANKMGLVLPRQYPGSPGTWNTEEKGLLWIVVS